MLINKLSIYVDGSYNVNLFKYGSGVVVLNNNEIIKEHGFVGDDLEVAKQRNVAGEMRAAMWALKYAKENGATCVDLYYDYIGVEAWVTGKWKAKNKYTQAYAEFMRNIINNGLAVNFRKVKAHSNDEYNDLADRLAKVACGVN